MDRNKQPKTSMRELIRRAWINRYEFDAVTISRDGEVRGTYEDVPGFTPLGNFSDYSFERAESMNVRIMKGESIIFTFAYDV